MSEQVKPGMTNEDLEREIATDLPPREVMSLIIPGGGPTLPILPDQSAGTPAIEDHMPVYQIQDTPE